MVVKGAKNRKNQTFTSPPGYQMVCLELTHTNTLEMSPTQNALRKILSIGDTVSGHCDITRGVSPQTYTNHKKLSLVKKKLNCQ